ncbi:MAG: MFS transporter, partial [Gammaproteobacteria bacterium]
SIRVNRMTGGHGHSRRTTPQHPALMQKIPLGASSRWIYGSAGTAYGVFYNSHYFVLIFYSQILGMDPALAGLAVGIGLVFDAITDPLVGYLSDNTHSRWGRRHPWLIASVLPLGASFYFLWHPPGFVEGDLLLFGWLALCNVTMRTSITMFLVPAYAMVAELTDDYDERTRLLTGFSMFFSIVSNGMSILMYAIWLVPTEEIPDGVLNPEGYQNAVLFGALALVISVLVFSIGLRRYIPTLRQYQIKKSLGVRQFYRQVADVFKSQSARMTTAAGVMYSAGNGVYAVLWVYIYSFFWEFTGEQIAIIVMPMALAALFLPPVVQRLTYGREKKNVAIIAIVGGMSVNVIPIALRLLGLFPENGSEALFWILMVAGFFETIFFLVYDVSWRSMIADLTERMELETGRRNEGVISSSITFINKCADGLGTLIGGIVLSLIAFPTETSVGEVPQNIIDKLGLGYGPLVSLIWLGAVLALARYRISRARHLDMLERLSSRTPGFAEPVATSAVGTEKGPQ